MTTILVAMLAMALAMVVTVFVLGISAFLRRPEDLDGVFAVLFAIILFAVLISHVENKISPPKEGEEKPFLQLKMEVKSEPAKAEGK